MIAKPILNEDALWRRRLRQPALYSTYVAAADPQHGIVRGKIEGPTVAIYGWHVPSGKLHKLTGELLYGWLMPDASYVIYLQDRAGSEIGQLVRVPYAGGPTEPLTPALAPFTLRGFDIARSGRCLAFNAVNELGYRIYRLPFQADGTPGAPRLLVSSSYEAWESILSYDGELLALKSTARAGGKRQHSTLVYDSDGELVAELWDGLPHSVVPICFAPLPGDMRLLLTTTVSGQQRPLIWHPLRGERRELAVDSLDGEIEPLDWSADGRRILLRSSYRAQQQLYVYDLAHDSVASVWQQGGAVGGKSGPYHAGTAASYFGPDGKVWAQISDGRNAGRLLRLADDGATETILAFDDLPPARPMRSIEYASSDGTPIQAWLVTPDGEPPYTTILEMHGGPHGFVSGGLHRLAQLYADHGCAYLSINFRGSTGFGQQFRDQINNNIGFWELEDMVAARSWLVDNRIADPDRIVLRGGSYGGFLTLWGLARRPELWAAGIAPVAIADWKLNYEDSSEALKGWGRALFGGTPAEQPQRYRASSPLTYAEQIRAPILIHQARNDSRATARQMVAFVERMADFDKDLTIIWNDSGHMTTSLAALEQKIVDELNFLSGLGL